MSVLRGKILRGMAVHNGERVRVNIRARVNTKTIRQEKRNGRNVMIVPSATMPDDVVMNNILYPADEIKAAYETLNRTPAPLGHPADENGDFLSASDPEAINGFFFGAWNDNARQEGGRVLVDKIIDVQRAQENEMGKRVLDAINRGDPIHTSTGLYCNVEDYDGGEGVEFKATNIYFDHDAILLDEPGAATPEQGVGMLVNRKAVSRRPELVAGAVMNAEIGDMDEEQIDALGMELMRAVERREDVSRWERVKSAVYEAIGLMRETETPSSNEDDGMPVTEEMFDALSAKVDALVKAQKANEMPEKDDMAEAMTSAVNAALAPVMKKVEDLTKAQNADAEAKLTKLREQVVNKNLLSKEAAAETPAVALEALLNSAGGNVGEVMYGNFSGARTGTGGSFLPEE